MTSESVPVLSTEEEARARDAAAVEQADGSWTIYGAGVAHPVHEHAEMAFADRRTLLVALKAERERIAALEAALDAIERDVTSTTEWPRYDPGEDFDAGWNQMRDRWAESVKEARAALTSEAHRG